MSSNTIEIVVRAVDEATRPLREISQSVQALGSTVTQVSETLTQRFAGMWGAIQPSITALRGGIQTHFDWIRDHVIQPLIDRINAFKMALDALAQNAQKSVGLPSAAHAASGGFRANGGSVLAGVPAGAPYVVGERGAEWFIPASSGRIAPNDSLGGDTYITVQLTLPDAALRDPGRAESIGETFGEAIARRLRERG